jgi:hypothetical protein
MLTLDKKDQFISMNRRLFWMHLVTTIQDIFMNTMPTKSIVKHIEMFKRVIWHFLGLLIYLGTHGIDQLEICSVSLISHYKL